MAVAIALGVPLSWLLGLRDAAPDIAYVRSCFASRGGKVLPRAGLRDPFAFEASDEQPIVDGVERS